MVAREVIPEEAHALHVREELGSVGQERHFERCEEALRRLQVAACECLEDVHAEIDLLVLGRVFGNGVGSGAQEVAVVADEKRRHHGVEVYHAEHLALFVEHHVIHLRVAVAHALLQFALGEESFAQAHLVHIRLNLFYELLHALGASNGVFGVHLAQLVAA